MSVVHKISSRVWAKRFRNILSTVKPVVSGLSKIDKPKILMTKGSVLKVKSIDLHLVIIGIENQFWSSF